mgnify:CR=1 FL=1
MKCEKCSWGNWPVQCNRTERIGGEQFFAEGWSLCAKVVRADSGSGSTGGRHVQRVLQNVSLGCSC